MLSISIVMVPTADDAADAHAKRTSVIAVFSITFGTTMTTTPVDSNNEDEDDDDDDNDDDDDDDDEYPFPTGYEVLSVS